MFKIRLIKEDYRETLLRSLFALLFVGLILGLSMNKILIAFGIRDAEPLISMSVRTAKSIPVWTSYVCGVNFTRLDIETFRRGPPGTGTDQANMLDPKGLIEVTTSNSIPTGDWTLPTGPVPCFVFKPGNLHFKPGVIDTIILLVYANFTGPTESGLIFAIFDEERDMASVEPFISPTPSVNTYTFTRSEKLDIDNKAHSYFSVNKQNVIKTTFGTEGLVARFLYSPDTYLVTRYTEKRAYTPYDLISAVGGLITYTLAAWFILFGRGKYRSWGLVQRYLLRSSPDARKKDDNDKLLPMSPEKSNLSDIENQIPITPPHQEYDDNNSIYYFSNSGTPTQARFSPSIKNLSPSTKDFDKRIEAIINQKLWSVEQTLSRHYLSGFKLRKYDVDLKKLGLDTDYDDNNNNEEILYPPTIHQNWNNLNNDQSFGKIRTLSPKSSQNFQRNDNIILNPEEQRTQYPNISIGQVPFEKKRNSKNSTANNINSSDYS